MVNRSFYSTCDLFYGNEAQRPVKLILDQEECIIRLVRPPVKTRIWPQ